MHYNEDLDKAIENEKGRIKSLGDEKAIKDEITEKTINAEADF
jgi:hypothetical protein